MNETSDPRSFAIGSNAVATGPAMVLDGAGNLVPLTPELLGWTPRHQAALDYELSLPWWRPLARRRARRDRPGL